MDLDIQKDLASNWFKLLQDAFCNDISVLENNKIKFKTTSWKRNTNKKETNDEQNKEKKKERKKESNKERQTERTQQS